MKAGGRFYLLCLIVLSATGTAGFSFGADWVAPLKSVPIHTAQEDLRTAHTIGKREVRQNPRKQTPSPHEIFQNTLKENPFLRAVYRDDLDQIRQLIQAGADLNKPSSYFHQTPLFYARSAAAARLLLQAGADIFAADIHGRTVLTEAVRRDDPYLTEFFLESGADVNKRTLKKLKTPLFYAKTPETARLLIQAGGDPEYTDRFGFTPLMTAVQADYVPLVRFFIHRGCDVNRRVLNTAETALFFVRSAAAARLLLQAGADVNAHDANGYTPLIQALKANDPYLTEFFLESGADVKARTFKKLRTPLFYAKTPETARLVLQARADVNAADKDGYTPLMIAVRERHIKLVKFLIASGADIHHSAGKVALHKMLPRLAKTLFKTVLGINDEMKRVVSAASHFKRMWEEKETLTDYYNKVPEKDETDISQIAADLYNGTIDTVNGYLNTAEHLFDDETVESLAPTKEIARVLKEAENLSDETTESDSVSSGKTAVEKPAEKSAGKPGMK